MPELFVDVACERITKRIAFERKRGKTLGDAQLAALRTMCPCERCSTLRDARARAGVAHRQLAERAP